MFALSRLGRCAPLALAAWVILFPASALPCLTMPEELARPHAKVVDAAKQIFLAVARGAAAPRDGHARHNEMMSLQVTQVLKGTPGENVLGPARGTLQVGKTIQLPGIPSLDDRSTFSDHHDRDFWDSAGGRLGIDGDCTLAPIDFTVGRRYLIFLGDPDDTKDAERIDSDTDAWLLYVAKRLKTKTDPR
jgi:hypothetical protein